MSAVILICGTMTVTSCSNEEDSLPTENKVPAQSHRLTAEQAGQNALDFVGNFNNGTRIARKNLKIAEVKAIGMENSLTRSVNDGISLDTLFYIVNFANEGGFVIAASDDREEPVYAYVEEGIYEDYVSNDGFDAFMGSLAEGVVYRRQPREEELFVQEGSPSGGGYRLDKFEVMKPLLVTKWDQGNILGFNKYCPDNCPTGCVPSSKSLKAAHDYSFRCGFLDCFYGFF